VFLESFRPGVAARLGVGYADIAALSPRVIYLSV
jgi:crotonobetainyl-CoA:carnitine CoA-transferase CaiB-like acyl-CoA transferase